MAEFEQIDGGVPAGDPDISNEARIDALRRIDERARIPVGQIPPLTQVHRPGDITVPTASSPWLPPYEQPLLPTVDTRVMGKPEQPTLPLLDLSEQSGLGLFQKTLPAWSPLLIASLRANPSAGLQTNLIRAVDGGIGLFGLGMAYRDANRFALSESGLNQTKYGLSAVADLGLATAGFCKMAGGRGKWPVIGLAGSLVVRELCEWLPSNTK